MDTFIAQRIEDAKDTGGTTAGQAKYRAYFGSTILQTLYGKYQPAVNAILNIDGYGDCIVSA
jgi:hypothetical protein